MAVEKTPHHVRHVDRIRRHVPDARFVIMIRGPEEFLLSYKHKGDTKPDEIRAWADLRWQSVGGACCGAPTCGTWRPPSVSARPACWSTTRISTPTRPACWPIQRHLGVDVVGLAGRAC